MESILRTIKTATCCSTSISSSIQRARPKKDLEPKHSISTLDYDIMATDKKRFVYHDKYMAAQKSDIIKISRICYGTAFLGLLLSIEQIICSACHIKQSLVD